MELAFLLQLLWASCFYATCFSLNLHNFMKFCSSKREKASQVQRSFTHGTSCNWSPVFELQSLTLKPISDIPYRLSKEPVPQFVSLHEYLACFHTVPHFGQGFSV